MTADSQPPALDDLLSHASWVRALARSLVADPQAADDVVQDTWVAAMERPPAHGANVRGWLSTVVRNVVRQRGRAGARRADRERRVAAERERVLPSSDELASRVETQRRLAQLVLALDEPYRQTLVLRYYEGLSSAEIARRTKTRPGTARWRLSAGLDQLRERLDDDFHGDRAAWLALFLPLTERDVALASTAAGGVGLLQGILAMNLGIKITVGATLAVLALVLSPLGSVLGTLLGSDGLDEEPLQVTFRPLDVETPALVPAGLSVAADRSNAEPAASGSEAPPVRTTGARLRCVDPDGEPVRGVRVFARGSADDGGVTDELGIAHAWVPPGEASWNLDSGITCDHPAFVRRDVGTTLLLDTVLELGDVVLEPAGAVEVRVLDSTGAPVRGAWVEAAVVENDRRSSLQRRQLDKTAGSWKEDPMTDADGRFLLERVAQGEARIWAGRDGLLAAWSAPVEVRGGMVSEQVVLTLGVPDPDDFIRGQVVDPEGRPVPGANVEFEYSSFRGSGSGSFHADHEGRFVLEYDPRAPRDLRAADREHEYAAAVAEGVVGGQEVELRLGVKEHMTLVVRGASGVLEVASIWGFNPDHTDVLVRDGESTRDGDGWRVPIPREPFLLEVEAEGHELRQLGPFDGRSAPRELDVALRSLPGVRGLVLADGEPLAGARVELYHRARRRTVHNGFPVRVESRPTARGTSRDDGTFDLTLRTAGEFFLRVSADGFAPAENGPHDIDPARGLEGLTIELTAGGTLEGRLLIDRPAGRIVAISRGDAHACTTRTDADGRYRFEHLTPGPWLVEHADEEISPNSSSTSSKGSSFRESDIESNCVVVEGETTLHDLSPGGAATVALLATLRIDGAPALGWEAQLVPSSDTLVRSDDALTGVIGDDGSVRIRAPRAGEYVLSMHHPSTPYVILAETLRLVPGETPWYGDFETGAVRFTGAEPEDDSRRPFHYLIGRSGTVDLLVAVLGDEQGVALFENVPVLPARLVRFDLDELRALDDPREGGTTLRSVELVPGETIEVALR